MWIDSEFEGLVFVGASEGAVRLRVQVSRMAPYYRTALVMGEVGVGKREVARELHRLSLVDGDFVCCPAGELTDEMVDRARMGTLYLYGLEALGMEEQDGLMGRLERMDRMMRARETEVRLVCSADGELKGMVAAGRMRQYLCVRISGMEIRVPALRERMEDLSALVGMVRVSDGAMEKLRGHGWPGNLAELTEMLRVSARNGVLREEDVPEFTVVERAQTAILRLDEVMRQHVADVLERCSGNKLKASELLGISRSTLYRMLDGGLA
ncbi:sigma-54-dependent Fis family transcriptional regulator [Granulicella tundricola]|nr:sigma-54-dependent Fis family transcriptional regulator [Granulicella tundricola]